MRNEMMMELQRTFTETYKDELRAAVASGQALPLYADVTFEINQQGLRRVAGMWRSDGLAERMNPHDDFKSAIALYEAFPTLSPLLASSEAFWAYLCHAELYGYVRERYPKVKDGSAGSNYVLDHFFFGPKGQFRNALASLWWCIRLTDDKTRADRYELSRVLFMDYSMRSTFVAPTLFIRHREAMTGVFEFILAHPELSKESFRQRFRFIAKYFNRLGAVKQITYLRRDFFRSECERLLPIVMKVRTDEDVSNESMWELRDTSESAISEP